MTQTENIVEVKNIRSYLSGRWVHDGINLNVKRGEIFAIVGGSGSGKTTLLRCMLMLMRATSGSIRLFGKEIMDCSPVDLEKIRRRLGVMFQFGALFSSLTILENVAFPLRKFTHLEPQTISKIALLKIIMAGLPTSAATLYPAELSGGMQKRAAAARAIALDPELLFLDEPTSGLDPEGASALDELVLHLRETLGLTIVTITHDLDSLWRVADRVAFLAEGKVLELGTVKELANSQHKLIYDYFNGPRGRAAMQQQERQ